MPYDIIIPARSEDKAVSNLKEVIKQCEDYGLVLNLKKCRFLMSKIEFLGHVVENQKIRISETKTKAVTNFPVPKNQKQLQSFLGLVGYYRKFILNFAIIAKLLTDLMKQDTKFILEEKEFASFEMLKKLITEKPIFKIFHPQHETELHTDASVEGFGAVLLQKSPDDGLIHPVYYMSKKTTDAEKKFTSYELEILET